ncbi:MAG: PDZ domain-containing protein [Armatimonadota bacterium]|nr:PDZ domain-containing protein [bacterium]
MFRRFSIGFRDTSLLTIALMVSILMAVAGVGMCAGDDIKRETTAAVEAVRPALIRIYIVAADYQQGREIKAESAGSGVIVSREGYAVTNHHVAADAERIVCTLADKREVDAKLIGTDPLSDVAVIKLVSPDGKPFPTAPWGNSSKLEVGDRVFAMGCPLALSQSVTMGIVSNTEMVMPSFMSADDFKLAGEDVGSIVRWVGHDALIRPGNSGGPLVNRSGEIVGINEISFGLSGAIPSNLVKEVSVQLIKHGKVSRSWMGLEVQPLLQSSTIKKGILVSGVMDDSPAQKAGFKSGDVLTGLNGRAVSARFREEVPLFNQFVADIPVGKTVKATVLRAGKVVTLKVTTVERQSAEDRQNELKTWGICGSNITYLMQKEAQLDSREGVLVSGVLPSGPSGSAKPAIREGDVIRRVGGQPVTNVKSLSTLTKKLLDGQDGIVPVMVDFERGKKNYATVVKIGKRESSRSGMEVRKTWLPIDMQVLTDDLAQALGVPGKTGVRVTQVYADGSDQKTGLQVGDLIVKLDGENIPADQIGDEEVLPSLIRQYDSGSKVTLGVIRNGQPMDLEIELNTSPKMPRDYPKYNDDYFEFTARDIAFSDKADGNVDDKAQGVYIESVADGGWAALGGLRSGDIITEIGGKAIAGLDGLKEAMTAIAKQKPKVVVFKVDRGIHTMYQEVEPSWPTL